LMSVSGARSMRNVWLALAAAFMGVFAFRLSIPVVAFYTRFVLEASAISIGALMAVFFAARTPASIVAGRVYRDKGSIVAASICLILSGVVTLCYAWAGSVVFVLFLRFLQGLLLGFAWTIVQIVLGASVPRRIRGTVYAVYFASGVVAFSIANAVYAALAFLTPVMILSISLVGFTVCGILVALMDAPRVVMRRASRDARAARLAFGVLAATVFFVFMMGLCTAFVLSDITYVYLKETYGLSKAAVARLFALASAIAIPASILLNLFADRVSDKLAVILTGMFAMLGLLAFSSPDFIVSCCGLFLLIMGGNCLTPLSRKLALTYRQAEGVGYVSAARSLGVMLSSLTAGLVYQSVKTHVLNMILLSVPAAIAIMASSLVLAVLIGREQAYSLTSPPSVN